MAIFRMPRFVRRFFRRRMNPLSEDQVWSAKDKLSIAYAIIAWNAAGFVLWQIFGKGKVHWPVEANLKTEEEANVRPAFQYARTLGIQKASVVRVSGLSMSDRVDFQVDKSAPLLDSIKILNSKDLNIDFDDEDLMDAEEINKLPASP